MSSMPTVIKVVRPKKTSEQEILGKDFDQHREKVRLLLQENCRTMCDSAIYEQIQVSFTVGERTTIYKVDCPQSAIGNIMGSKGKNIEALRTITLAMCARYGFRAIIELPYFPIGHV